jgi:hypothetical protein
VPREYRKSIKVEVKDKGGQPQIVGRKAKEKKKMLRI